MGKRSRRRGEQTEPQDGAEPGEEPAPEGAPWRPLRPDGRLREVALLVEEADYLLALYRWIVLTGEVPRAQDWLRREEWPHPDYVIDVFGSWEKFLQHAEIPSSPLLARVREADDERRSVAARQQQAERDLARVEDLRRQVETAKRRREAADTERGELSARAERLAGQLERAEARAAAAEAHLAERRQQAEELGRRPARRGLRRVARRARGAARRARHRPRAPRGAPAPGRGAARGGRAGRQGDRPPERDARRDGRRGRGQRRRPPSRRSRPPRVAEAVERAEAQAQHLVFTRAAHEAAADSPYRRPADVLDTLMRLDELAALYADPEGFGRSLSQAADELGLTWRQNVSELARSRNPHAYSVMHDGERLELGPHVAIGSGSGAGFIARIYLHVADGSGDVPRGLYVGHVGRHLPDTTTA